MRWLENPPDQTPICLGFDGSENNDWTAIRAETATGFSFTPRYGPDDRPTIWNPAEWGGQIPRAEVAAAVHELFDRYRIKRMYADPLGWRTELGEWALQHGEQTVQAWPTNSINRMFDALRRFETDLATGRIKHDGCPLTATAFNNAKKAARPGQKYLLAKASEHQKIDPVMATVLAHEAAMDSHASGWKTRSSKIIVHGIPGRRSNYN